MKITCPISGISYDSYPFLAGVNNNINALTSKLAVKHTHPIFSLEFTQLLRILPDLDSIPPNSIGSYLIRCSLLAQLPITFHAPINKEKALPFLVTHTQDLISVLYKLQKTKPKDFPTFIITKDTSDLSVLKNWIATINECFDDYSRSAFAQSMGSKLARYEATIERLINSSVTRFSTRTASIISEWAAVAGQFPNTLITVPHSDKKIPLSEYWKQIIKLSFKEDTIEILKAGVSHADIQEVIEACENDIPHGSVHAHMLMAKLRATEEMMREFKTPSKLPNIPLEVALMEPKRHQFSSVAEFLRAKIRWQSNASRSVTIETGIKSTAINVTDI